jgi:hypothetical protein
VILKNISFSYAERNARLACINTDEFLFHHENTSLSNTELSTELIFKCPAVVTTLRVIPKKKGATELQLMATRLGNIKTRFGWYVIIVFIDKVCNYEHSQYAVKLL